MKQLLLLITCLGTLLSNAQTNTFNGGISNDWNEPLNWSLTSVPNALNDVIIPTGKTVNIYSLAQVKSLQLEGTAILLLANNLSIQKTFSVTSLSTFNWSSGALTGGGTVNNLGAININPAGSKSIEGGVILNNWGVITFITSWSVSINDGTINNLPSGVIDLQVDLQIGGIGSGSHVLNNQGLIKKTVGTGICTIYADLVNTGTITSEAGYLDLNGTNIKLNGGIYNASSGAQIRWYGIVNCSGTLTGNLVGDMVWVGKVNVTSTANLNFSKNFYWASGSLMGGGTLTNMNLLTSAPYGTRNILEKTVLKNSGTINVTTDWNISINDGTLNNTASGIIDFQVPGSGIDSDNSTGLHTFNNSGLLKKTGLGTSNIRANLTNTGTISAENGLFVLNDPDIVLNGGIYNVSANANLQFLSTVTLSGTISGNLIGDLQWYGTVNVPNNATLQFSPNSNFKWVGGILTGGGNLINNSTFYYSAVGSTYLDGGTTLTNASLLNDTSTWEIIVKNGTINNLATGIIDLQTASSIIRNGTGTHLMKNAGLIKKTASTGTASIYLDLENTGIIESSFGTIAFDNLNNTLTGTVRGIASVQLQSSGILTNNGTFSPGGSPGTLGFYGNYTSTSNTKLSIELKGLTQGTQYDNMFIVGDAIMNGNVVVTLGFEPAINDEFIIASTSGIITFGMVTTTTAIYNGKSYKFNVVVQNDNKLKLILANKTLATNSFATLDKSIILTPNPAKDYFKLYNESGETLIQAEIIDLNGRTIKIIPFSNINIDPEIRIDGLASGQYLLKVNTIDKSCVKRFIAY